MSRLPGLLPPSRYRCRRILLSPLRVGVRCAHQHHHSSSYAALPQEPSLRSGFCCPGPSTLNRPHPPHSRAQRDFTALQLIRPVFAVRYRLDDPRLVPCFHCHSFSTCRPLRLRGVQRLYTPSSFTANAGLRPFSTDSALPRFPQILSTWGTFRSFTTVRLRYDLLIFHPPTDLTGFASSHRGFLKSGFQWFGSRSVAGYRYGDNWVISTGGTYTR